MRGIIGDSLLHFEHQRTRIPDRRAPVSPLSVYLYGASGVACRCSRLVPHSSHFTDFDGEYPPKYVNISLPSQVFLSPPVYHDGHDDQIVVNLDHTGCFFSIYRCSFDRVSPKFFWLTMLNNSAIANDILYVVSVETSLLHTFLGMRENLNITFVP